MSIWRYSAVAMPGRADGSVGSRMSTGEIAAESQADARASLRRIGLQVLEIRPARRWELPGALGRSAAIRGRVNAYLRGRRTLVKAEQLDGLATMLESGAALAESLDAMVAAGRSRRSAPARRMLVRVREAVRGGRSLSEAIAAEPAWFDRAEIAMVEAAQRGGELSPVLRRIGEARQRRGELAARFVGVLTYPAMVTLFGLGVVVFLSRRTLPQLVAVLETARVAPPPITRFVLSGGELAVAYGWLIVPAGLAACLGAMTAARLAAERSPAARAALSRLVPRTLRDALLASFTSMTSELLRCGVPLVDAMRTVAPTLGGPGSPSFRRTLDAAIEDVEQGASVGAALGRHRAASGPDWFDAEALRLIELGEASGELALVLRSITERTQRRVRRRIDRLATIIEPAAILLLAVLVGGVVLAAVLPMLKLQEVLG